jgi:hypothetical protein
MEVFLAIVPPVGVAIILLAVWLAGGGGPRLLDADTVRRRIAEDLPGTAMDAVVISSDGAAALATVTGAAGLVAAVAVGDKVAVRRLDRGDVATASRDHGRLVITTGDFGCRRIALTLPAAVTDDWWRRVAALAGGVVDRPRGLQ